MITRQKILEQAYIDCLTEMYKYAQPTLDLTAYRQSLKGKKEDPKDPLYARHYLSTENYKYIRDKYMRAYGILGHWTSDVDVLIEDAEKGYNTDVYGEDTDGEMCRHYEQQPPLAKSIGVDAANKVIAFLKDRRQFYRFDREVTDFTASLAFGPSPNSNAEHVKQYWKEKGFDLDINEDFKVEDLDYGIEEEED